MFSWGNRKDGRLGFVSSFDDGNAICLPKPIFGSLYLVSEMCAKYWNSIIIAEQIIDKKPVRSISCSEHSKHIELSIKHDQNSEIDFHSEEQTNVDCVNPNGFPSREDSTDVPEWLKKDLEDAEFISADVLNVKEKEKTLTKRLQSELVFFLLFKLRDSIFLILLFN